MTPAEIIDSYVVDVARNLPRRKQSDVAAELRELLNESLNARAEETGRPADAALTLSMLREFGRPAEVAARYHTPFSIVEPADTRNFLIAIGLGVVAIFLLSLPKNVANASHDSQVAVLWWVGLMVIIFAIRGWIYRSGKSPAWKPRRPRNSVDNDQANRFGSLFTIVMTLGALAVYLDPAWIFGALSGGRADPEFFTYAPGFLPAWRVALVSTVFGAYAALYVLVMIEGRWRTWTRWADWILTFHIAVQLAWRVNSGPISLLGQADKTFAAFYGVFSLALLLTVALKIYLEWRRVRLPQTAHHRA